MPLASPSVAVIGTGYVGLVTAACLAAIGHRVTCVDADAVRIAQVARGEAPFHEDGLPALVTDGIATRRLAATTDLAGAVAAATIILVAVGTPSVDGAIDLSAIEQASRQIGAALKGRDDFPVVAIKSTVVPGTTGTLVRRALEETSGGRAGKLFGLAMNPEFLSQGSAVHDFVAADRIVVGEFDRRSGDALAALYRPFPVPVLRMGLAEAEMVKYAANGLQATLISYANQIAALCEAIPGADQAAVLAAVHLDRMLDGPNGRAGACHFLMGGIGFGGSCFPKDLQALAAHGRRLGVALPLVEAVSIVNAARPAQVVDLLAEAVDGLFEKRVAVLGLAFKPGTDDLRESPALAIIRRLEARGALPVVHDPLASVRRRAIALGYSVADTAEAAMVAADAAIIATAWPEYRALDWPRLAERMRNPVVLDGRNMLNGLDLPRRLRVVRVGARPAISAEEDA